MFEIIVLVIGFIFLYSIIIMAINNSKLAIQLKQNNDLSKENNKVLKEIRNLMKQRVDNNSDDQKTKGYIMDEKR